MTECNRKPARLSNLNRKDIVAGFVGGTITFGAGGLLLREVVRWLGLTAALAEVIPDPSKPVLIQHEQRTMPAQRVHGFALGYEDLNDHQTLRDDPLLQTLAAQTPDAGEPLASALRAPPTPRRPDYDHVRNMRVSWQRGWRRHRCSIAPSRAEHHVGRVTPGTNGHQLDQT